MTRTKMSYSEAGRLGAIASHKVWIKRYNDNPKYCLNCNEKIPYEKRHNEKFCDSSCAASYNNKRKQKKPLKICPNCKKEIPKSRGYRNNKFCNTQCHIEYKWKKQKEKILETNGVGISSKILKKYLFEIRGHCCEICKRKTWNKKPIPLIMDHINGNSENDNLENLRLVCPNCDMQSPTWGNRNRGNGRYWRRKRYSEGKSC